MKKTIQVIMSLAFIGLSGCASLFYKKMENPHFFLAQKGEKQVYVLGTFHAFVSVHELPSSVLQTLKTSEVLVLEVPPVEDTFRSINQFMARLDRGIVKSTLSDKDWAFYQSLYKKSELGRLFIKRGHKMGMDNFSFGNIILRSYVSDKTQEVIEQANRGKIQVKKEFIRETNELSLSLKEDAQMDRNLYEIGRKNDLVMDYLDREIDAIIEIEQEISEIQFEFLLKVAKKIEQEPVEALLFYHKKLEFLSRLADLYRSGKPIEFDQYMDESLGTELRQKILQKRNQSWVRHFQNVETGYQKIFIAVGASHLYGTGSFLEELKNLGYSVRRVGGEGSQTP